MISFKDILLLLLALGLIAGAGFSLSCTGQGCEKDYPAYKLRSGEKP